MERPFVGVLVTSQLRTGDQPASRVLPQGRSSAQTGNVATTQYSVKQSAAGGVRASRPAAPAGLLCARRASPHYTDVVDRVLLARGKFILFSRS
jgi:hypothetical protein